MYFFRQLVFKCLSWFRATCINAKKIQVQDHHTARKQDAITNLMMMMVSSSSGGGSGSSDKPMTKKVGDDASPPDTPMTGSETAEIKMTLTFPPQTLDMNKELKFSAEMYEGPWKNEAVSREVNVLGTIYHKQNLLILHCKCSHYGDFCVKLRYPFSSHEEESSKYLDMKKISVKDENDSGVKCDNSGDVTAALYFPEVFAFIKVKMLNNEVWGGICMKLMGQPVVDILFVDAIPKRKANNVKNLAKLSAEFWKVPLITDLKTLGEESEKDSKLGGVCVKRMEKRGIQTSLAVACLELLHKMHMCGWVHGDSHLGNFVLDPKTWRVYAIDVERSFASNDAVQHMLDIQEFFGHACGLIVSYSSGHHWDMDDIWGVAAKLHPLLKSTSKKTNLLQDTSVLHMLPVCTCFTEEEEQEKLQGCICCRSKKNVQTANFFKHHGFTHIQNLFQMSLKAVRAYVSVARKKTIMECGRVGTLLLTEPCKRDLKKFISLSQQQLSKPGDMNASAAAATTTTEHHYINLDDKNNFDEWLRKILYLGAFFEYWRYKRDKLIHYLRHKGHSIVVDDLLSFKEKKHISLC